ncbi:MAG: hypothetical protein QXM31_03910 [Candidatus Woesearchaeota archaeon]
MAKLTGLALLLLILGVGSLVLPMMGLQFKIFMIFELLMGAYAWIASVACIVLGVLLMAVQVMMPRQEQRVQ